MTTDSAHVDRLFRSRVLRAASAPLSLVYGAAIALRPQPEPRRVPACVLSIGNVHAGGTGKTPHVRAIARHLRDSGHATAIVSRGYGGSLSRSGARVEPRHRASEVGDEPRELADSLKDIPVFIGADRVEAATAAAREARFLVLDDAFQHRRLARDLDIVLVPAGADPARQRLLPWGRLREPLSALKRADLVVLVHEPGHTDYAEAWRKILDGPVIETRREPAAVRPYPGTVDPVALLGRSVVALSGIAGPDRFHASLDAAGAIVVETLAYPDHHAFTDDDLALAARLVARLDGGLVVTTAKDAARLDGRRLPFPCAILETRLECAELLSWIDRTMTQGWNV